MAGKKINELTQAANVADTDLFIVETANGTQSVPYSSFKSEGVSFNGTGANSIAIGSGSVATNGNSVALGFNSNSSGEISIAIGKDSIANKRGAIAIGFNSKSNGWGTAIGHYSKSNGGIALGNSCEAEERGIALGTGVRANYYDIAIGGIINQQGANCIAISQFSNSAGDNTITLGLYSEVNGHDSIAIGTNSSTSSNNSIALGARASTSNANSIQLGDAANLSSITAKVSITTTSDERDKTDITEIKDSALEFLNKVKAIRYVFNGRKLYIDNENLSDEEREKLNTYGMCDYDKEAHAQGTKKGSRMRVGVSAQNIQQALIDVFGDSGYANLVNDNLFDYNPDDIPDGVESQLAVNYEGFIPFLIKAVQELDAQNQKLNARVTELENK